jgi:hypothetical protein
VKEKNMGYETKRIGIEAAEMERGVERLLECDRPRLRRLWHYYQNPMRLCTTGDGASDRPYRQGQEWGLPRRITGVRPGCETSAGTSEEIARKEVVIENDIGWRIDTMVDYLFGKPLVIRSAAADEKRREKIDPLIRAIIAHNGGILFLQQLALLGAVYGFVDVLVKLAPEDKREDGGVPGMQDLGQPPVGESGGESSVGTRPATAAEGTSPAASGVGAGEANSPGSGAATQPLDATTERIARRIRLEIVEPSRALPLLSLEDYRQVVAYAQCYPVRREAKERPVRESWWQRVFCAGGRRESESVEVVEIITDADWQKYEGEKLVDEGRNDLGEIPLVHIQNTAAPFAYAGASDVEGLIPLQDELNTRLSDRANRITLQSFKMYLGKGIENFNDMPVGPGRMWAVDNENAEVQVFGGDDNCPSELAHIADLREALDKSSGVSPIAAGAIKNRIGRLTSAAALRITLISLLARTEKKRTTYGLGLQRMIELALAWLDRAGLFATDPEERRVEIHWPSPLPENDVEKLQEAEAKLKLGVAKEVVLKELGY